MSESKFCMYCEGTGLCDFDAGGGNVRQEFCYCEHGERLKEEAEKAKDWWENRKEGDGE